jgi:hypothetical protein
MARMKKRLAIAVTVTAWLAALGSAARGVVAGYSGARDRTRKRLATWRTPGAPRAACSITLRSARDGTSPSKVTLPVSTAIFTPLGG